MRNSILTIIILISAGWAFSLNAQSPIFSIFDAFEEDPKPGEGKVVVHMSEGIKQLIGTRLDSENIDVTNGKTSIKTMGYRIQVYLGNHQQKSREEAITLQKQILEQLPELSTYLKWDAPIWRLHVGDFRFYEEAWAMVRELRALYPKKKNEIYILEDEILLPLD